MEGGIGMKECPKCRELVGDSASQCFNCRFDFAEGRIISVEEVRAKKEVEQKEIRAKQKMIEDENAQKEALLLQQKKILHKLKSQQMITTGYNFEGYKIDLYLGNVSGETVLGTGFLSELSASFNDALGSNSRTMEEKMGKAKDMAIRNMVTNAIEKKRMLSLD